MKTKFFAVTLLAASTSLAAGLNIEPGQSVVEFRGAASVQTVASVNEAKKTAILADGKTYSFEELDTLVQESDEFKVGQTVVDFMNTGYYHNMPTVQKIIRISSLGAIQLQSEAWYSPKDIRALVTQYKGFKVGQKVCNSWPTGNCRTKDTIEKISKDGKILLENRDLWMDNSYITIAK